MDDYRKAAADSREWGRKARKAMKASVRMDLVEDLRREVWQAENPEYTFDVIPDAEDEGGWIGICPRFPSLSWCADSKEEALAGIKDLVASCFS